MRLRYSQDIYKFGELFQYYKLRFPNEDEWVIHTLALMDQYAKQFWTGIYDPNIPQSTANLLNFFFTIKGINDPNQVSEIINEIRQEDPLHFRKVYEIESILLEKEL